MSNDLADMIRARFTPFAFTCECNGTHPDCYRTRTQDARAIATHQTIERVATFIEDYYAASAE
jgi:hypothetical protein